MPRRPSHRSNPAASDACHAIEVTLESLAYRGDAVGHVDRKAIFVPYGAPGDHARVRIVDHRRSYARGELLELLREGPQRCEPPCALFGRCGGCQWQHVDYPEQLRAKTAILERALSRGRTPVAELRSLIGTTERLAYRRRTRMQWRTAREGLQLGFFVRRGRELLDVQGCPALVPPLERAVERCRAALRDAGEGRGTVTLLCGTSGQVHLSLRLDAGRLPDADLLLQGGIAGGQLAWRGGELQRFGAWSIPLQTGQGALHGAAAAFAQAHAGQDDRLRALVESWAAADGQRVLELYAGLGNLTGVLARGARELVAVEQSPLACELLRRNLAAVGARAAVIEDDAAAVVARLVDRGEQFDLVVLDPPREGCAEVAARVAELRPARVIYVSCDPMTLARDLQPMAAGGLHPVRAQGLDMMPQTYHIEAVALLEHKEAQ